MLNKYFKRREFACRCGCGTSTVDAELLQVVTDVREHFGSPVVITSGHRCAKHNANVGGAKSSMHLLVRLLTLRYEVSYLLMYISILLISTQANMGLVSITPLLILMYVTGVHDGRLCCMV